MTIIKFGLVGLLNTAFGFSIILSALALGLGDYAANALGYGFGLVLSFVANRYWTFAVREPMSATELARFGAVAVQAYAANLLVVGAFRMAGWIDEPVVHLIGITLYSALFYHAFWCLGATRLSAGGEPLALQHIACRISHCGRRLLSR